MTAPLVALKTQFAGRDSNRPSVASSADDEARTESEDRASTVARRYRMGLGTRSGVTPETGAASQRHSPDTLRDRDHQTSRSTAPRPDVPASRIVGLQKWEGRITTVENDVITAELTPLDHEGPTLLADFDLDLLTPDDGAVEPGDLVYLTVRTVRGRGNSKSVTSSLRLKRMGRWSESELQRVRDRARTKWESIHQHAQ